MARYLSFKTIVASLHGFFDREVAPALERVKELEAMFLTKGIPLPNLDKILPDPRPKGKNGKELWEVNRVELKKLGWEDPTPHIAEIAKKEEALRTLWMALMEKRFAWGTKLRNLIAENPRASFLTLLDASRDFYFAEVWPIAQKICEAEDALMADGHAVPEPAGATPSLWFDEEHGWELSVRKLVGWGWKGGSIELVDGRYASPPAVKTTLRTNGTETPVYDHRTFADLRRPAWDGKEKLNGNGKDEPSESPLHESRGWMEKLRHRFFPPKAPRADA